jgi:putative ABC transport system permease protein
LVNPSHYNQSLLLKFNQPLNPSFLERAAAALIEHHDVFRIKFNRSDAGWEQMGGIISLRDAQVFSGKPRKVAMYFVKLKDPEKASQVTSQINREFKEVHASMSSEFVENMPDMKNMSVMLGGISFLAVLVGGVGVLNTMLMAVMERTREIGVLRALGWRRRNILAMIMEEAGILGVAGGIIGILIAFVFGTMISGSDLYGQVLKPLWEWDIFAQAILIASSLGIIGGLYPAYRATCLQPTEALRYE